MKKFIPLSVPNFSGNELEYVTNTIKTEWVSTAGSFISEFEEKVSTYVGVSYAAACQSGTAGIHLALKACNVEKGNEVIVPTLTFIAAINPVKYVGANPIFMDCDETLTIDPIKVKRFCEEECDFINNKLINKKTKNVIKAIIVVHIFGNIVDMESICNIGRRYNLKIIEDATEALGSYFTKGKYKHKYAGTVGDIGIYSFNGNKIITTGGGGMIVSNIKHYVDYCKYLSTQAKDDDLYFTHDEIGYNYRMTNIQSALGLAQLEQLEKFINTKRENYFSYIDGGINLMGFRNGIRPNYWFYSHLTHYRDELIKYLSNNNVQARPIWKLIHTQKPYINCIAYDIEKSVEYYQRIVNIPCSSNLSESDVKYLVDLIKKFYKLKEV